MPKIKSKMVVVYALVGLGVLYIFWPAIKGFITGAASGPKFNQPRWY